MTGILAASMFISIFLFLLFIGIMQKPDSSKGEKEPRTLKEMLRSGNKRLKLLLVRNKKTSKKKDRIEQSLNAAGVPIKPEEYMVFRIIAMLIGGGLLYLLSNQFVLLLVGSVTGYLLPRLWLQQKQSKRMKKFNDGLPGMITSINGSIRAGFSLLQSLQMVAEEAHSPIKEEVQYVLRAMQYGTSLDEALQNWKVRMPSKDLDMLVEAILIQRQVGGNLAYLLDRILETTRERSRIENQIKTLTAQGRLSGLIISLLPVGLGIMIYLMNPSYISTLFYETIGQIMLGIALVGGIIGFVLIRKITKIEV
ncbi:type II secretion system F family protein [Virgibacillus senegalensis]|uniref:type II secretion system F family protein n=1 Tax=Virgibacillus senegalensis TaxID=1499679 RepID=UPI00069F55A7|nr:type II secretion system F family protein [Virgibacillus senegalensis]